MEIPEMTQDQMEFVVDVIRASRKHDADVKERGGFDDKGKAYYRDLNTSISPENDTQLIKFLVDRGFMDASVATYLRVTEDFFKLVE